MTNITEDIAAARTFPVPAHIQDTLTRVLDYAEACAKPNPEKSLFVLPPGSQTSFRGLTLANNGDGCVYLSHDLRIAWSEPDPPPLDDDRDYAEDEPEDEQ